MVSVSPASSPAWAAGPPATVSPTTNGIRTVAKSGDLSKISTDSIPAGARNTRGEQVILAVMGNNVSALYKNIFD